MYISQLQPIGKIGLRELLRVIRGSTGLEQKIYIALYYLKGGIKDIGPRDKMLEAYITHYVTIIRARSNYKKLLEEQETMLAKTVKQGDVTELKKLLDQQNIDRISFYQKRFRSILQYLAYTLDAKYEEEQMQANQYTLLIQRQGDMLYFSQIKYTDQNSPELTVLHSIRRIFINTTHIQSPGDAEILKGLMQNIGEWAEHGALHWTN